MSLLPHIQLDPESPADAAVIWLHGLGADGHDFEAVVPELKLPQDHGIRFIFPHAPSIPVTVNGGYVMPAWYDILEMSIERKVDLPQLLASVTAIRALIERELERGIDSRRIIVAGFSQGGAVAYETALTFEKPLGGLLALSTYLASAASLKPNPANAALPILVMHGEYDGVVPEVLGRQACEQLKAWGYQPQYRTYGMEHSLCLPQIEDISRWLQKCLAR